MSRRLKTNRYIPSLLKLEAREVPAGNITTSVFSLFGETILRVDGDSASNHVIVNGDSNPGEIRVSASNTTINGSNQSITYANIDQLWVDLADGNDVVQARELNLPYLQILTGAGDDTIEVNGYTRTGGGGIQIGSDDSSFGTTEVNGDDTIIISNTRVTGTDTYMVFGIYSDTYYPEESGHDVITMNNTDVVMASTSNDPWSMFFGFGLDINGVSGSISGPGDEITINNLDVVFEGPGSLASFAYINGSTGNDDIRLNNIDMTFYTEYGTFLDFWVDALPWADGDAGEDNITVTNVDISLNTPGAVEGGAQIWPFFSADTVSMSNVTLHGGEASGSGNIFGVTGRNIDLRNVSVTSTEGWTLFFLGSIGTSGGPVDQDTTITLNNVTVAAGPNFQGEFQSYLTTEGGNDAVTIRNSSLGSLNVDLGAGDDSLALFDCSLISALLIGGDGHDRLTIHNNYGLMEFFDFENV